MALEETTSKVASSSGERIISEPSTAGSDEVYHPSLQTIVFQFMGLSMALILYRLRKSAIHFPITGWRVEMIGGVLPAECLILSLLVLELGWRDARVLW